MAIWTQADIDKLKAAVAEGVLMVTYAGPPQRSITYQSLGAMRDLLAEMVRQVQKPTTFRHASFAKGFDRRTNTGG